MAPKIKIILGSKHRVHFANFVPTQGLGKDTQFTPRLSHASWFATLVTDRIMNKPLIFAFFRLTTILHYSYCCDFDMAKSALHLSEILLISRELQLIVLSSRPFTM